MDCTAGADFEESAEASPPPPAERVVPVEQRRADKSGATAIAAVLWQIRNRSHVSALAAPSGQTPATSPSLLPNFIKYS